MKYTDLQLLSACFASGLLSVVIMAATSPEPRNPCIDNYSDTWLYYMEQSELTDIDETETEKLFHDIIVSVVKDQGNLYVSKSGREYVVPSYCYVEDTGFFVKLWSKND